jgi:hypothetical protein
MRVEKLKGLFGVGVGTSGAAAALALLGGALIGGYSGDAQASAAFARQTGMSCFACHTRPPSMTAIGKRFFLQGYRAPSVRQTVEHGEPGSDGGRMNITLDEMQWWRIRSTPLIQEKGKPTVDPNNKDKWFTMPIQRFSWGVAGPIGDYVSLWNEIYYQPYDASPDRFAPGGSGPGANSRGNWRQSTVEVDELEIVIGKELPWFLPGNYFGWAISDRGYRKVQNRGGTGLHATVSGAGADNGGMGIFGFWNDKYYVNLHFMPGTSVNWNRKDVQFNVGWWPRNTQQDDLFMDVLYTVSKDSDPTRGTSGFGFTNAKDEGRAFDFRVQYIKADWGVHTIDTEWGIGYVKDRNHDIANDAVGNVFRGMRTSGGARYWYNRRFGGEILYTRWLKYEETSNQTGQTLKYIRKPAVSYGALYQLAANTLFSFEIRQTVGNPFLTTAPAEYRTRELKLEINF